MMKPKENDPFNRFLSSFRYAFNGIGYLLQTQRNARIHFIVALCVVVAGYWFGLSPAEWLFLFFSIGLVISAELFNTSIEKLTDLAEPGQNPVAGKVKDLAAGGVLVAALTAAVIGLIIFIPHIVTLFRSI